MTNDWNDGNSEVLVGYFERAEDAQNAIFELRDQGFSSDQVGAAFHSSVSGSSGRPYQQAAESSGEEASSAGKHVSIGSSPGVSTSGSGATGARSDDSAVTATGLGTGSGTGTTGASRPGPIKGFRGHANVPGTGADPYRAVESSAATPPGGAFPETGGFSDTDSGKPGLWDKLTSFFGGDSGKKHSGVANESSLNFGTGEGHLGVTQPATTSTTTSDGGLYDSDPGAYGEYEGSGLEGSFYGMGVPQDRARSVSHQVSQGGAVVTVKAGGRGSEAEKVLERNGARIRHEVAENAGNIGSIAAGEDARDVAFDQSPGQNRVVLFGEVLRVHRNRFTEGSSPNERKVS